LPELYESKKRCRENLFPAINILYIIFIYSICFCC
jgi:hypothetical protein